LPDADPKDSQRCVTKRRTRRVSFFTGLPAGLVWPGALMDFYYILRIAFLLLSMRASTRDAMIFG